MMSKTGKSLQQTMDDDSWPNRDLEELRKMVVDEGKSYKQISVVLKKTIGQIAGKCHKYGWRSKNKFGDGLSNVVVKVTKKREEERAARRAAQAAKAIQLKKRNGLKFKGEAFEVNILPSGVGVSLIKAGQGCCRFAVGSGPRGEHLFCDAPVVSAPDKRGQMRRTHWCAAHIGLVYEKTKSAPNPGFWRLK